MTETKTDAKQWTFETLFNAKPINYGKSLDDIELPVRLAKCTKRMGDHLIWDLSEEDKRLSRYPRWSTWKGWKACQGFTIVFALRTGKMSSDLIPEGSKLRQTCGQDGCIAHHRPVKSNRNRSVEDMSNSEWTWTFSRFVANCKIQGECCIWEAATDINGYGFVHCGGKGYKSHRLAWELANRKKIPKGLVVRHSDAKVCSGGRRCCSPLHLQPGTAKENAQDRERDGKGFVNGRRPGSKLTEDQVLRIIASRNDGRSVKVRAEAFGVKEATIRSLDNGKTWEHLFTNEEKRLRQSQSKRKGSTLSEDEVRQVKRAKLEGKTVRQCSETFDVSRSTIHRIYSGQYFKWIKLDETPEERTLKEMEAKYERCRKRLESKCIKVEDPSRPGHPHWLWQGYITQNGYGWAWSPFGTSTSAHTVSYLVFRTKPSLDADPTRRQKYQGKRNEHFPGQHVRHMCTGHKNCVAPDHLEIGTPKDNAQDRREHKTLLAGESNPNASISEETARAIFASQGTGTLAERAKRFNTSFAVVAGIDSKRTWKLIHENSSME